MWLKLQSSRLVSSLAPYCCFGVVNADKNLKLPASIHTTDCVDFVSGMNCVSFVQGAQLSNPYTLMGETGTPKRL